MMPLDYFDLSGSVPYDVIARVRNSECCQALEPHKITATNIP